MRLLLVRHGQSLANIDGLVCGQMDSPLSELGRKQASMTREIIERILPNSIPVTAFASPLVRAWDTASIAFAGRNFTKAPELMELDTGSTNCMTYHELFALDGRYEFMHQHPDLKFPDGESVQDMFERVIGWLRPRLKEHDTLILFAHAYALNCILHAVHEEPLNTFPKFQMLNGSVFDITLVATPNVIGYKAASVEVHNPETASSQA